MNETLFKTVIGSHVWSMETPESDYDIFECYIAPSEDFLIGSQHKGCHHSINGDIDRTSAEIGTVVNQILKNNINYLINILSPVILLSGEEHEQLKKLTIKNLSKLCYNSINGMATHNYMKYIINESNDSRDTQKRRKTILRVINFGITLLRYGKIEFEPIPQIEYISKQDIQRGLDWLADARDNSILSDQPQHKEEMYKWLLNLRLRRL